MTYTHKFTFHDNSPEYDYEVHSDASPSDIVAVRHGEVTDLLRELLAKMTELLADRDREHARYTPDHR